MMLPEFVVWEWVNSKSIPMYVGFGKITNGVCPAICVWNARKDVESHLTKWLCRLKKEPRHAQGTPNIPMTRDNARKLCLSRRLQCRKEKIPLLSHRPFGTTRGGGAPLGVTDDKGIEYDSVRAAAAAHGVNACTVSRRIANPLSGWHTRG